MRNDVVMSTGSCEDDAAAYIDSIEATKEHAQLMLIVRLTIHMLLTSHTADIIIIIITHHRSE